MSPLHVPCPLHESLFLSFSLSSTELTICISRCAIESLNFMSLWERDRRAYGSGEFPLNPRGLTLSLTMHSKTFLCSYCNIAAIWSLLTERSRNNMNYCTGRVSVMAAEENHFSELNPNRCLSRGGKKLSTSLQLWGTCTLNINTLYQQVLWHVKKTCFTWDTTQNKIFSRVFDLTRHLRCNV